MALGQAENFVCHSQTIPRKVKVEQGGCGAGWLHHSLDL
jgi:hypothetical protein